MVVSASIEQLLSPEAPPFPLSSRPERTRISYFALLATSTYAALLKESRMQIIKAAGLDRKSRRAQRRDLRFSPPEGSAVRLARTQIIFLLSYPDISKLLGSQVTYCQAHAENI
jgi:hypothetical protein